MPKISTSFLKITALGGSEEHVATRVSQSGNILGYKRAGKGPVKVIFLHDWSVSADGDYVLAAPFFDGDIFDAVFADLRGYGASFSMTGDYSAEEISNDVQALADSLDWDHFCVVGHSMTGLAVQKIMADIPDRLIKAVAVVPVPAIGTQPDDDTFSLLEAVPFDDEAFRGAMATLTSDIYGNSWLNFKLLQNRRSVRADAMKGYVSMFARSDFSHEIEGCVTPLLVLFGSKDSPTLRKETTGPWFSKWFPHLTTEVLPTGHYPMLEAPISYAHVVEKFLRN